MTLRNLLLATVIATCAMISSASAFNLPDPGQWPSGDGSSLTLRTDGYFTPKTAKLLKRTLIRPKPMYST